MEEVLWYDGAAGIVCDAFARLPAEDRADPIKFVRSQ